MGEGTGSPKPRQGERCFPDASPAAGTMAESTPGKKQVAEAENRTQKETLGKHMGQHWGERGKPRRQMEGTKADGGKKKNGDERVANNRATVVKEWWL